MSSAQRPRPLATQIFRSLADVPADFGPCVAVIGNFDGVHRGHREILTAVADEARSLGGRAIAITFDPHPAQCLRPEKAPKLLAPLEERLRLLSETGVDAVLVLRFDAALAALEPGEFVRRILVDALGVRSVHEGQSFRFGRGAAAGVDELARMGTEQGAAMGTKPGFAVHVHPPVCVRGLQASSSAIRALVAAGDMRRARWLLGRPFAVVSTPAHGRGIGTRLLVPTVNLAAYDGLLPAFGVYVTRLKIAGRTFQSVTNVGNRPTFGAPSFAVESHILNFEPMELNDETRIELEFLLRLRGEIKFPSPEALKEQIFRDVARAKRYFSLACRGISG